MFQITLLDHLRLSFGGTIHAYKAHIAIAERLTRRLWHIRIGEFVLLAAAMASALAAGYRGQPRFAVLAAVLSGAALSLFAVYVAINLEARINAHRWCASRLWLLREKYRALLSEMRDGMLSAEAVRERRDQLLNEMQALDDHAPLVDLPTYQSARQALATAAESALTDEEIDRFLPQSLRKDALDSGDAPPPRHH
ncbi:MAG TPA: SLATT domain-containing protein [Vicinamibacterales bacterium]|nr:SLATT domain-containing protein [Vicinamibacterales bacterium]